MSILSTLPNMPTVTNSTADIWVIVPAFNEERRIASTLRALCGRYKNVVVVDDGSTDRTAEIASRFPVWVLRHVLNCGQGAALQTGVDFALHRDAQILVTFDADGQHTAEEIEQLVEPVAAGRCDVTLGSRFLGQAVNLPWSRWLTLKLGVLFTWAFSGVRLSDAHNGLRAFSRQAAERLQITHSGMAHASEIVDRIRQHRLTFLEVPVTVRYCAHTLTKGQSSLNAMRIVGQLLLGRFVR